MCKCENIQYPISSANGNWILKLATVATLATFSTQGAEFNMLSCCPGEDTANEARFVWHSDSSACLLYCAKASDPASAYDHLNIPPQEAA